MTRKTAREIAIQLGFAAAATGEEPHELLDRFFEKEHYESLAREDELYAEVPDEKQLAYITRLVTLLDEHRDEIDIPDSAAINEAVELAKGYDEPDTVAFVNGVLGGYMRGRAET